MVAIGRRRRAGRHSCAARRRMMSQPGLAQTRHPRSSAGFEAQPLLGANHSGLRAMANTTALLACQTRGSNTEHISLRERAVVRSPTTKQAATSGTGSSQAAKAGTAAQGGHLMMPPKQDRLRLTLLPAATVSPTPYHQSARLIWGLSGAMPSLWRCTQASNARAWARSGRWGVVLLIAWQQQRR